MIELFLKTNYEKILAFLVLSAVLLWLILYLFVDQKTFPIEIPYSMLPVIINVFLIIQLSIFRFAL